MPITLAWFHSLCFSSRNQTEIARGFRLCWLGAPLSQPAPLKIISFQCHNLFAGQAVPPLSPTSGLWPSKWGAPAPPNCVVFCLQLFPFHPTCFPTPYSRKRPNRCLVLQKNVTGQCLIQYREEGAYGSKGSLPKQGTEHEVEKVSGPPFSSTLQFTTAPHRPHTHTEPLWDGTLGSLPTLGPQLMPPLCRKKHSSPKCSKRAWFQARPYWLAKCQGSLFAACARLW